MQHGRTARYANRAFTLVYLTILLLVPLGLILYRTFSPGVGAGPNVMVCGLSLIHI